MLSIIIPTLNEEDFLKNTLKEIKRQDFENYEIIVADAGSNDNTKEIAKDFNCKIVEGGSPAQGRNSGAEVAQGDILLFLDSDLIKIYEKDLKKGVAEFKKKNLDGAAFPIKVDGNWFDKICYIIYNLWARLFQLLSPYGAQAILVRKEIHDKIGGFDEEIDIGEDHFYMKQVAKKGKVRYLHTRPFIFSSRRMEKEGRIILYSKYLFTGAHMTFLGPIKNSKVLKYQFDHYRSDEE